MNQNKYKPAHRENCEAMTGARPSDCSDSYRLAPYNSAKSCLPSSAGVHGRLSPILEELEVGITTVTGKCPIIALQNLEILDFIVDITVVDSLAKNHCKVAKYIEYNCELSNDGLLPLSRLDRVLSADKLPPIKVERRGSAYKVIDGRHRLARAFIRGESKIPAIVLNSGHDDYIMAGGESNPGPDAPEVKPMIKQSRQQRRRLYQNRCRKSSVPENKASDTINEDHINTVAPNTSGGVDVSVRGTGGKRNTGNRKSNKKGYRRSYRSDRIELDIPMVQEKEEFNSDYLAKLLTTELPSRQELELRFRAAKLNIIYDCPCGKKNYGFPSACGCTLKDQVLALYNNMAARDIGVLLEDSSKPVSDIILEKGLVASEIKSVESALRAATVSDNKRQRKETAQKLQEPESSDLIVRKRRGLYRILKTPGVFNFREKFNHHHESIAKTKDQSRCNGLVIPDDKVIDELYCYLRRNEFEAYPDRAAKLAHMTKLAAKWDVGDFKLGSQGRDLAPIDLNRYFVTIQKVTDAKDTEFLLQEVKAYHSNSRFKRVLGKLGCFPRYLN